MLARAFAVRESEMTSNREWGNQSTTWTRLILRPRSTDRSNVGAAPIRECLTRIGARNPARNQFRPSCRGGDLPPAATARHLFDGIAVTAIPLSTENGWASGGIHSTSSEASHPLSPGTPSRKRLCLVSPIGSDYRACLRSAGC